MTETFTPADMPQRRSTEIGAVTEGHNSHLRGFAFFRYRGEERIDPAEVGARAWHDTLKSLSDLAEPEEWTGTAETRPYAILERYLMNTHQRLVMEDKICVSDDGRHAAFNTGLLTHFAEEIFALFSRNQREGAQRWFFMSWAKDSDRDLLTYFPEPPQMAEYVAQTADLVYDWRRELKPAYDHILGERLHRFPPELQANPLRARQAFDFAIDMTLRRARRNYKMIVPQWNPALGEAGASFLLPLDLTGTGQADLALVASAIGDRAYRGHTVLGLAEAYSNARLVARPDSEWLVPSAPEDIEEGPTAI